MKYDVSKTATIIGVYADWGAVSEYAQEAMEWAAGSGVLIADKALRPTDAACGMRWPGVPGELLPESRGGDDCPAGRLRKTTYRFDCEKAAAGNSPAAAFHLPGIRFVRGGIKTAAAAYFRVAFFS